MLDYCAGGDLFFHLARARCFPEHVAQFYAASIAHALEHVHANSVVYRDVKVELCTSSSYSVAAGCDDGSDDMRMMAQRHRDEKMAVEKAEDVCLSPRRAYAQGDRRRRS